MAISGDAPFSGLWHQAIQCHTTCDTDQGKKKARENVAKTELADARERGVDKDTADQPTGEILAEVLGDFLGAADASDGFPTANVGTHAAIEIHQGLAGFGWRQ